MKREGRHSETEHEFTPPYTVWNDQAGEINQEYLDLLITRNTALEEAMSLRIPTAQRAQPPLHVQWPVFSKLQILNDLKVVNSFNQAVDKLGELEFPLEMWINGAEDKAVNWMLTQGGVLFSSETNIEILSSPSYVYDQVVSSQGLAPTPEETNPLPAELTTCRDVDKVAANLHWQLELPWAYPLHSSDGSLETVEQAIRALHVPPVASNAVSKGIWEVYAEETLEYDEPDLGPVMRLRPKKGKGKTAQGDDDEMWYDRQLKRKLIFSNLPPLPAGSVNPDEEFGRPVLSWPFGARANDKWLGRPLPIWMYKSQEANRGRVGEEYRSPPPPHDEPMEIDIERAESQQLRTNSVSCATTAKPRREPTPPLDTIPRLGSPVMSDSSMVSLGKELPSKEIGDVAMPDLFVPGVEIEMASMELARQRGVEADATEFGMLPSPYRDSEGRVATRFLWLRGMGFSSSIGDLRWWVTDLERRESALRIEGIYRVNLPSYDIDYLVETGGVEDATEIIDWYIDMEEGDPNPDTPE
ncbi:hypothetical protein K438DRAFT_1978810 [Mycena galopus ATCC 62051]|nr:hypothetical protein K438DRAFT_1978810 [Mycena galopus ATCC 62051]